MYNDWNALRVAISESDLGGLRSLGFFCRVSRGLRYVAWVLVVDRHHIMFTKTTLLHTAITRNSTVRKLRRSKRADQPLSSKHCSELPMVRNYRKKSPESLTPQRNVIMTYRKRWRQTRRPQGAMQLCCEIHIIRALSTPYRCRLKLLLQMRHKCDGLSVCRQLNMRCRALISRRRLVGFSYII